MSEIVCSGGLLVAKDTKRFLFLLRSQGKTAGTWGIVGGKKEPKDLTPYAALEREIKEEIGDLGSFYKSVPLELYTSEDQKFYFNTYLIVVEKEFIPKLNQEHVGYAWCNIDSWPKPLHEGVKRSLSNKINRAKIDVLLELIKD